MRKYFELKALQKYGPVGLLLIFIGACIFIRSIYHELFRDEAHYCFVLPNSYDNYASWIRIASFADIWQSQLVHVCNINGRFPMHFIQRLFSGYLPIEIFYIINALVFIIFCILVATLSFSKALRTNLLLWCITLSFVLLFVSEQAYIWTSINLSLNYLWPCTLCMGTLILFKKSISRRLIFKGTKKFISIIICFFAGWSNEGFALPLLGAFIMYYLINFKTIRAYLTSSQCIFIPFCIGIAALLSAPGNYVRLSSMSSEASFVTKLTDLICFLQTQQVLWLLFAILIISVVIKFKPTIRFVKDNALLFITLILSICFMYIGHTAPRSMMMGQVMCIILLLKLIGALPIWKESMSWQRIVVVLYLPLFCAWQINIVAATIRQDKAVKILIQRMQQSKDGVALLPEYDGGRFLYTAAPRPVDEVFGCYPGEKWSTISLLNGFAHKPWIPLNKHDYNALKNPTLFYVPENRADGSEPLYHRQGGTYTWVHPDSTKFVSTLYKFECIQIGDSCFYRQRI